MAVITAVSTALAANDSATYSGQSFTPVSGLLLGTVMIADDCVEPIPRFTSAGGTQGGWDLICSTRFRAGADTIYFFMGTFRAEPTLIAFNVSVSPTVATGCGLDQISVAGMDRLGRAAVRQFAVLPQQAAAGVPAITFDKACLTGNPTITIIACSSNPPNVSAPVGWTLRRNTGYSPPTVGYEYASRDSGFTGTTITWGGTCATEFGIIGVELDTSPLTANDVPPLIGGRGATR